MRAPCLEFCRSRRNATRTSRAISASWRAFVAARASRTASWPLIATVAAPLVLATGAHALVSSGPAQASNAQVPAAGASAAPDTLATELSAFISELERLIDGDESMLTPLRARVERLESLGRPDPRRVLDHYARLSVSDRKSGRELFERYKKVRIQLRRADEIGMSGDVWLEERAELLSQLRAFLRDADAAADTIPAARGHALRARLQAQHLRDEVDLDEIERAELLAEARAEVERSLAAFERAGFVTPTLEPVWIQGCLAVAEGAFGTARERFTACYGLARRLARVDYQEFALSELIRLAREAGDPRTEQRWLHELAGLRRPSESWQLAQHHGEYLLQNDEPEHALRFLSANPPRAEFQAQWHLLLGSAFARAGQRTEARAHYAAARASGSPAAGSTSDTSTDAVSAGPLTDAEIGEADLELDEGHPARAMAILGDRTRIDAATPRARGHALRVLGEARLASNDAAGAVEPLRAALALAEYTMPMLDPPSAGAATDGSRVGEFVGLETVARLAEAHARLGDALEAARCIEDAQSRSLRAHAGATRTTIDADDVRAWAASSELGLVTWVLGADTGVVAHVRRDGTASAATIALGRRALEDAVRRVREAVIAGRADVAERLAAEVQAAILPAAVFEVPRQDFAFDRARVLLLLHGPLERLPIEVLPLFTDDRRRALVPRCLPGLPTKRPAAALARGELEGWSLLGAPLDALGAERLPGARVELDELRALRRESTVRIGADFTREAPARALTGTQPLHVATHLVRGSCAGGERLGLELNVGAVFCESDLRAAAPKLPLVVLSACETGGGAFLDAEGLESLGRVFLSSGTRNLLVTSWPVDDARAREFALAFHHALATGNPPSIAAQRARATLRASGADIADWAAFRFLGTD